MRLFAAFAVLPFAAAALAYVWFPVFERSLLKQVGGRFSDDAAGAFAAATFVLAVFVTLIAIPVFTTMRRRAPITFGKSLLAGIALGNAPFLIVSALILIVHLFAGTPKDLSGMWYGPVGALRTVTLSTLMGAALGSVFWVVGIRARTR